MAKWLPWRPPCPIRFLRHTRRAEILSSFCCSGWFGEMQMQSSNHPSHHPLTSVAYYYLFTPTRVCMKHGSLVSSLSSLSCQGLGRSISTRTKTATANLSRRSVWMMVSHPYTHTHTSTCAVPHTHTTHTYSRTPACATVPGLVLSPHRHLTTCSNHTPMIIGQEGSDALRRVHTAEASGRCGGL